MATQLHCDKALKSLVKKIRRDARRAGIQSFREMEAATRQFDGDEVSYVSRSGFEKIWNFKSYPTFDTLLALANACGVSVTDWITEDMQQEQPEQEQPEKPQKPEQPKKGKCKGKGKGKPKKQPEQPEQPQKEPEDFQEALERLLEKEKQEAKQPEPEAKLEQVEKGEIDILALLKGMAPPS